MKKLLNLICLIGLICFIGMLGILVKVNSPNQSGSFSSVSRQGVPNTTYQVYPYLGLISLDGQMRQGQEIRSYIEYKDGVVTKTNVRPGRFPQVSTETPSPEEKRVWEQFFATR